MSLPINLLKLVVGVAKNGKRQTAEIGKTMQSLRSFLHTSTVSISPFKK